MIFLNKKTGVKWEINEQEHIRRLLNDEDYEANEKETVINIDYDSIEYSKLQTLAREKGLKSVGIKKEELIKSLKEGE